MSFKTTMSSGQTSTQLSKNQNEIILKTLSEGVCHIDLEGQITYANESARRLLECGDKAIIGRHYQEVFFAKDKDISAKENSFCPIDFALQEGEISHVSTDSFYKSVGELAFLVEYICVPVKDGEEITGAVISFQDVTERRDVEITIAKARDAALEAARAKAVFLANMSHEIRTPLSGIVGTADLLLDSNLTPDQRKYAEILKKSTDLLTHIVNEVLDFSKLEAGKFAREKIDFNIEKVARETIEFFETLTREKDLTLKLELDRSLPKNLYGDVNSIRQILNNLISNAIKFTEAGEVLLKIDLLEKNEESGKLKFSVKDTGIGIDDCEKLFQPFTQADSSMTRKFGGTGLGLAICRQLVDLMDGQIKVKSRPGSGSTFWFECDFAIRDDQDRVRKQPLPDGKISFRGSETPNILIVEDNPANREIISQMLRQMGLSAKTAADGRQAVERCIQEEFDLILMDCQMPGMDGFEATERILEQEHYANPPKIVAFTAGMTRVERDRFFNAGMDDYLSKPFTKQDLANLLKKHFPDIDLQINLDLNENMFQHSLSKIIEPKMLENLLAIESNNQPGFIFEILDIFSKHAKEKFAGIRQAINGKNRSVIKADAHNLKGSSANVGLTEISEIFEDLEMKSNQADWIEIQRVFEKAIETFNQIEKIILDNKP